MLKLSKYCLKTVLALSMLLGGHSAWAQVDQDTQTAEAVVRDQVPVKLRLSPKFLQDEILELTRLIDANPALEIGDPATHEIAPHPDFFERVIITPIKRKSPPGEPVFDRDFHFEEAMTTDEIVEQFHREHLYTKPWLTNVEQPRVIGAIDSSEFSERLNAVTQPIIRRAALLSGQTLEPYRTTLLCISGSRFDRADCPVGNPRFAHFVRAEKPQYISVKVPGDKDAYVSVIAIAPGGSVHPLLSGKATPNGDVREVNNFDDPVGLETWGRYKYLTIITAEPIDRKIWLLKFGDQMPAESCSGEIASRFCGVMTGKPDAVDKPLDAAIYVDTKFISYKYALIERMVGGLPAGPGQSEWQAQLFLYREGGPFFRSTESPRMNFEKAHKCGGSYLGSGYILTAAHCIRDDITTMRLRLGTLDITKGGSTFRVHSVVIHKRHKEFESRADVALIKLDDRRGLLDGLEQSGKLEAIELAGQELPPAVKEDDLIVTGWGYLGAMRPGTKTPVDQIGRAQRNPKELQFLSLEVTKPSDCTSIPELGVFADQDIVCAKGKYAGSDSCAGDSGGPVTQRIGDRRVLVGVVSAGKGCAQARLPAVYMKASRYADWIKRSKALLETAAKNSVLVRD